MEKFWVAVEDSDTNEVSEFEEVTIKKVLYLMNGYMVDRNTTSQIRVQDTTEDGRKVIYDGARYKGGFGYNLWVTSREIKN